MDDECDVDFACPDCGVMVRMAVHRHGDIWVPDDPELPELRRHVEWNPELHPTFVRTAIMATSVTVDAADRRTGLTVGELRDLLDELDDAGASGQEPLSVVVTVRGRVKSMTVEVVAE